MLTVKGFHELRKSVRSDYLSIQTLNIATGSGCVRLVIISGTCLQRNAMERQLRGTRIRKRGVRLYVHGGGGRENNLAHPVNSVSAGEM